MIEKVGEGNAVAMPPLRRTLIASLLAAVCGALSLTATAGAATSPIGSKVKELPVSFTVSNVNQTLLPCATDGQTYTIHGHLNGTAAELKSGKVTLLQHGLGLGEFFWRIQVPGYDFTKNLATRGHATVSIDRLGYGASGKPDGNGSCIGGQADIAHQIIGDLKSGVYAGVSHPKFAKVGLIGHSAGGQITEVESYSFHDATAIGILAYADQGISTYQTQLGQVALAQCAEGGKLKNVLYGPPHYETLGSNLDQAYDAFFHSAPSNLLAAAAPRLSADPCGDLSSYVAAMPIDMQNLSSITQPVLLVQGADDSLFPPPSVSNQAALFTGSSSVSYWEQPDAGHALTYEAGHTQLANRVASFLSKNGL